MSVSFARLGLDMLLTFDRNADVVRIDSQVEADGPWLEVDLSTGRFAIWKHTGAVYHIDQNGAAEDDPFLIPLGSPFTGGCMARAAAHQIGGKA